MSVNISYIGDSEGTVAKIKSRLTGANQVTFYQGPVQMISGQGPRDIVIIGDSLKNYFQTDEIQEIYKRIGIETKRKEAAYFSASSLAEIVYASQPHVLSFQYRADPDQNRGVLAGTIPKLTGDIVTPKLIVDTDTISRFIDSPKLESLLEQMDMKAFRQEFPEIKFNGRSPVYRQPSWYGRLSQ